MFYDWEFLLKWAFFNGSSDFRAIALFAMLAADTAPLGSVEVNIFHIPHGDRQPAHLQPQARYTYSEHMTSEADQGKHWWPALHSFCSAIGGLVGRRPFGSPRWPCRWSGWWSTSNSWVGCFGFYRWCSIDPDRCWNPSWGGKCFWWNPTCPSGRYEVRPSDDGAPATAPSHARHEGQTECRAATWLGLLPTAWSEWEKLSTKWELLAGVTYVTWGQSILPEQRGSATTVAIMKKVKEKVVHPAPPVDGFELNFTVSKADLANLCRRPLFDLISQRYL